MRLKPSREQIANAGRSSWNCPYAAVIREACPNANFAINVHPDEIHLWTEEGKREKFPNSDELQLWIGRYDKQTLTPEDIENPPVLDIPLEKYCEN